MKKALSGSPYGNCTNEFSRFELLEIRLMFICTGILKPFMNATVLVYTITFILGLEIFMDCFPFTI